MYAQGDEGMYIFGGMGYSTTSNAEAALNTLWLFSEGIFNLSYCVKLIPF